MKEREREKKKKKKKERKKRKMEKERKTYKIKDGERDTEGESNEYIIYIVNKFMLECTFWTDSRNGVFSTLEIYTIYIYIQYIYI